MRLIDSHCHLDVAEFDLDRDAVVMRAKEAGVVAQIIPAIAASGFSALADLCRNRADRFAAYGLHPLFLDQHRDADIGIVARALQDEGAVAVGECGLDFLVDGLDRERQLTLFDVHLRLASDLDLPLIIHARRAVDPVIAALRRFRRLRGVVHSFSGSESQAQQLFRLGFCLGIGGPISYSRALRLRRIVAHMPLDHLLLESDAPDQPLADARGARNEPAAVAEIARVIASLRAEPAERIAQTTTANAIRLFRLDQFGLVA